MGIVEEKIGNLEEFSDLERIKYSLELMKSHRKIASELASIDTQIRLNQVACSSHKGVCIESKSEKNYGNSNTVKMIKKFTKCLICNKKLDIDECNTLANKGLIIYYLNDESIMNSTEVFHKIQMMYEKYATEYADRSDKEIFEIFKTFMSTGVNINTLETGKQYYK